VNWIVSSPLPVETVYSVLAVSPAITTSSPPAVDIVKLLVVTSVASIVIALELESVNASMVVKVPFFNVTFCPSPSAT